MAFGMTRRLLFAASLAGFGFTLATLAGTPDAWAGEPTTAQILAQAKAAQGGDALALLHTLHYQQRVVLVGIAGTGDEWDDTMSGRTVSTIDAGPLSGTQGFDGTNPWQQDATGVAHRLGGADDVAGARTQAYFTSYSEFFPGRRGGIIGEARAISIGGSIYDVLTVTPAGGLPTDVYIDRSSHLIVRLVEHYAPFYSNEIDFSDYRTVDGIAVPFVTQTQDSEGNGSSTTVVRVWANAGAPGGFTMPAGQVHDFSIASGAATTVPIDIENNHIYLKVRVDGKGPYRFVFDTGGQAVLDSDLAAALGVRSWGSANVGGAGAGTIPGGAAWVNSIQIGAATLRHQSAAVLPLGQGMQAVEGLHIDGMVGWEVPARYLVTVDYLSRTMTLTMRHPGFRPPGFAVPIRFTQTIPEVHASVDGLTGYFAVDTGNRQSLVLSTPFVAHHGLDARYRPDVGGITGFGVGGPTQARLTRVRSLDIGGVDVPSVVTGLSTDTQGAGADPGEAGNIGGGVWKRFIVTFDYPDGLMYLQPNARFAARDAYDRSGMFLVTSKRGITVLGVLSATPAAAAGLTRGDVIESVDGRDASAIGLLGIRSLFDGAPGTRLTLRVISPAGERDVTLTLRDYV